MTPKGVRNCPLILIPQFSRLHESKILPGPRMIETNVSPKAGRYVRGNCLYSLFPGELQAVEDVASHFQPIELPQTRVRIGDRGKNAFGMGVAGVLLILWFVGVAMQLAGSLIHFVLLAALIILIIDLLSGDRRMNEIGSNR
jgi:4-hydroxybenzoate polyprenyltransferase